MYNIEDNPKVYGRKSDLSMTSAEVYCKYSGFCSCYIMHACLMGAPVFKKSH
jgi:hypothetical protein